MKKAYRPSGILCGILAAICLFGFLFSFFNLNGILRKENDGISELGRKNGQSSIEDFNQGWSVIYEDGKTENINLPAAVSVKNQESIILKHEAFAIYNRSVLFTNNNYDAAVYADEKLLYQANHTPVNCQGRDTTYAVIYYPKEAGNDIRVVLSGTDNGQYLISPMVSGGDGTLRLFIWNSEKSTVILIISLVFMVLVVLAAIGIRVFRHQEIRRCTVILIFIIISIIWGITDSDLPSIHDASPGMMALLKSASVFLLPVVMARFAWLTATEKSGPYVWLTGFGMGNFIFQIFSGQAGFTGLQKFWYLQYLITAVLFILSLIRFISLHYEKKEINVRLTGGAVLFINAAMLISLLLYRKEKAPYYRLFFLSSVLVFIFILMAASAIGYYAAQKRSARLGVEAVRQAKMAYLDEQTGLKNRRAFEWHLEAVFEKANAQQNPSLVVFDVNNLKKINDLYGHQAGDILIREVADVIRNTFRSDAVCFRIGGDEFAAVMETRKQPLACYRERFSENLRNFNDISVLTLSIAAGSSDLYRPDGRKQSIDEWKEKADEAMYDNKKKMKKKE